jgi:hypothetical protein
MVRWFCAATLPVASAVLFAASHALAVDFDEAFAPRATDPTFSRAEATSLFATPAPLTPGEEITTGSTAPTETQAAWWVVVASLAHEPGHEPDVAAVRSRVATCGLEISTEAPSQFVGFRPGYLAVVVGPLTSKAEAAAALAAARSCVPDANMRQARRLSD